MLLARGIFGFIRGMLCALVGTEIAHTFWGGVVLTLALVGICITTDGVALTNDSDQSWMKK